MSTRIVTLFGEEIVPEPQKPVTRIRGKKNDEEPTTDELPGMPLADAAALPEEAPSLFETAANVPPEAVAADSAIGTETSVENAPMPEVVYTMLGHVVTDENTDEQPGEIHYDTSDTAPEKATQEPKELPKKTAKIRDRSEDAPADIIPEDWQGSKQYYGIGEVAGFFKVNTSHIRFWTNEFKLKVRTNRKGDRLYTTDQVKELRAIYYLVKGRGFTLSGAKAKLKTQNKRDVTTVDLRTSLQLLRSKLIILRDQLGTNAE